MLRDVDREEIIETLRNTTSSDVVDTVESALDNDRDRLTMLVQQAASRVNLEVFEPLEKNRITWTGLLKRCRLGN